MSTTPTPTTRPRTLIEELHGAVADLEPARRQAAGDLYERLDTSLVRLRDLVVVEIRRRRTTQLLR